MATDKATGDASHPPAPASAPGETASNMRIKAAAWTAGVTGFCALAAVDDSPTWPMAFAAGCVVLLVGWVCYLILFYRA